MFCSCYCLLFFTLVILKGIDSKTKQDGHLVDKKGNRFRGTCDNYHEFECQWNAHCPGKCDDDSSKAGNYCKKNISCPNGKCIRNICVKPTGVCSNDSNGTCKKNKDCRPHKCVIPTGFCEDDPAVSCKGRIDCPGTCVQSSNSKKEGVACTKRGHCGKNGKCHRSRCIVPPESATPSDSPSSPPNDARQPSNDPSTLPTTIPSSKSSDVPSALPSTIPSSKSSGVPSALPSTIPSSKPSDVPSALPSTIPSSKPSDTPKQPSIEEALLNDKLFGPSSNTCNNYVPKDGEYSFTFDLKSLPYFDNSLAEVEEVKFQVHISHTDSNEKRNWSLKLGKGGDIYSFKGPYGESIPPNTKTNMQFVDEVNQKVCVDSAKNQNDSGSDNTGSGYFIHQAGVYQNGDPGYTDQMPFWFSPNVSIYCSTTIPECRMASWGQQSYPRPYTERIIYYDRYRDCGDGILERTHIIHNAETKDSDTLLTFTNMPWGGTRYSTLKDFVFSQSSSWNYAEYNLPGGIEDPMRIFVLKPTNHKTPTPWTLGYTIFAQDLPYVEYPNTPLFEFPGRLPKTALQPVLTVDLGTGSNKNWICQGPLNGYDLGTYRCRFKSYGDTGTHYIQGCHQCDLRIKNPSNGKSFGVFNIRHWKFWDGGLGVHLMYFQTLESKSNIDNVCTLGSTLTVAWDEVGKSPEENLALSFVHGTSQQMIDDNRTPSRMRFGHSNSLERDFAVLEYISFPNLRYGDSFRARQYYVTDGYAGLGERSEALADDTIEEVITSGELELSQIQLHYASSNSASFGASMDGFPCNSAETTTVACAGSTTPQLNKDAFLQITCGSTSYVGTDFYHFSNYPNTPHRPYTCKVNGANTSDRPTVKLLGYFGENDCGDVLQDKVYDANFCSS